MELDWLEDFLALAASGSFSRAAEGRHVTQPAFSRRIRALEDWAGVPLVDRSAHPASLTEAGRRFRPAAEEILRRLASAREEARAAEEAAAATLRFAATHALSFSFFPAWLRRLEPGLRTGPVQLVSDSLQACEELMLGGRAQFLLCHLHPEGQIPVTGLGVAMVLERLVGLDGGPPTPPGLYFPYQLLDPAAYFARLRRIGGEVLTLEAR